MSEFVVDCLNRKMNLRDVARKWNMGIDDVFDRYIKEKKNYNKGQIDAIMKDVYYRD